MKNFRTLLALFSCIVATVVNAQTAACRYVLDGSLADEETSRERRIYNDARKLFADIDPQEAVITVAPGVYWIDDSDDKTVRTSPDGTPVGLTVSCRKLSIIGLDVDPRKVVFACQRGQTIGAVGNFTMFRFLTDSLMLRNITMGNYVNVDLDYPYAPEKSRRRLTDNIVQAQLAFQNGDALWARNCRFVSRLNLCPVVGEREAMYKDCHFESTDDALNGNAVYVSCDFDFYSGKPIYKTSGNGAVFEHCTFNILHDGEQYITKHSSPVTLVDCQFNGPSGTYVGWTPYPSRSLRCIQAGVRLGGNDIVVGSRNPENTIILQQGAWSPQSRYTGLDVSAPQQVRDGDTIHVVLSPRLRADTLSKVLITATDCMGREQAAEVEVLPRHLQSPEFSSRPTLKMGEGRAEVIYALSNTARKDESRITWTRIRPDGKLIVVSESTSGSPARAYEITRADIGSRLEARIVARQYETDEAEPVVLLSQRIKPKDTKCGNVIQTDFRQLPLSNREISDGAWTFCGFKPDDTSEYQWEVDPNGNYWRYGRSDNGCQGEGLTQTAQGARMVYTPMPKVYGDMSLTLQCDPQKTAGQGFSSARGQYMDVYIKYDTRTKTGYGLRIERTGKHSNAVDFTLMKFVNGRGTPVSESVSTTCYLTGCVINISLKGNTLHSDAMTSTPQPDTRLAKSVSLSATVSPNSFGGFGIQHTGTTGEGQTMLHHLKVEMH